MPNETPHIPHLPGSDARVSHDDRLLHMQNLRFDRVRRGISRALLPLVALSPAVAESGIEYVYSQYSHHQEYYDEAQGDVVSVTKEIKRVLDAIGYGYDAVQSDEHCSQGDAQISQAFVNALEPRAFISLGDYTNSGEWFEKFCVDQIYDGINADVELFGVIGNHDTTEHTLKHLRAHGVNVAGQGMLMTMKDGTTIYSAPDPTESRFRPGGTKLRDPEISIEQFEDTINLEIKQNNPNIVIIHDSKYIKLEEERPLFVLAGHQHRKYVFTDENHVVFTADDVSSKAGGKQAVIAPHVGVSRRTIMIFDKKDPRHYIGYLEVTVENVDGKPVVKHSPIRRFPGGIIETGDEFLDAAIAK